jgi:MoxR-like ATPase
VSYPSPQEEKDILLHAVEREHQKISKVFGKKEILNLQKQIEKVEVSESVYEYICRIVFATRNTKKYTSLAYGASPRASLALLKTSKVLAVMQERDFVIPEDVKDMCYAVLRHRLILSYEALADGVSSDDIITEILLDTPIL